MLEAGFIFIFNPANWHIHTKPILRLFLSRLYHSYNKKLFAWLVRHKWRKFAVCRLVLSKRTRFKIFKYFIGFDLKIHFRIVLFLCCLIERQNIYCGFLSFRTSFQRPRDTRMNFFISFRCKICRVRAVFWFKIIKIKLNDSSKKENNDESMSFPVF